VQLQNDMKFVNDIGPTESSLLMPITYHQDNADDFQPKGHIFISDEVI
jgi:hypothetical protein